MSQQTLHTTHRREVIVLQSTDTTHPHNATNNHPSTTNPLMTVTLQQAIINKTIQSRAALPDLLPSQTMIHPSRLALMTNTAQSSNTSKSVKVHPDFNELIDTNAKKPSVISIKVSTMERHKHKEIKRIGLDNLYKIGKHLFLKTQKHYIKLYPLLYQFPETADTNIRKMQIKQETSNILKILRGYGSFLMIWRKQLSQCNTLSDALTTFAETETFHDLFSILIPQLWNQMRLETTKIKKKSKKPKKEKEIKCKKEKSNNKKRKRTVEILDDFTDYGVIKKPLLKKRKLAQSVKGAVIDCCVYCKKALSKNDGYKCAKSKACTAIYCDKECAEKHIKSDCNMECDTKDDIDMVKNERTSVCEWNWYSIIYWLNRVKNGRFNNMEYLNLRKHIFIGRIKGNQINKINDITLNMIGINDYNRHELIMNAIAELVMNDDFDNEAMYLYKNDMDIPQKYLDPISYEVMNDPVFVEPSGKYYERKCIEKYMKQYNIDPFTKEKLKSKHIKKSWKYIESLKNDIDEWKKANVLKRNDDEKDITGH